MRFINRVRKKGRVDECNECAVSAWMMPKETKAITSAMNVTVTMIADEISVTTMTNRDRLDDECDDETSSFGKKCETSRSELQLLKAAETKGKYLEV